MGIMTEGDLKEAYGQIRLSEGEGFQWEEGAVLQELQGHSASPMAVKILSVLGGCLAMLTSLGFLMMANLYQSQGAMAIVGVLFIVVAIVLNKSTDNLLLDTFGITSYILGYTLLGMGMEGTLSGGSEWRTDLNLISAVFICIAVGSLLITQNYMLSFLSVLVVFGSLLSFLSINNSYDLIHLYIPCLTFLIAFWYLHESDILAFHPKIAKLYNPVCLGLVISFLAGLAFVCKRGFLPIAENYVWISSISTIGAVVYLLSILMKTFGIHQDKIKWTLYGLGVLVMLPTAFSPAISGAILILLLSYYVKHVTGFVIGIVSLFYFLSQYYYDLNFTLLVKSGILFSSGLLFLVVYFFSQPYLQENEKV
jgi:hypothetical protein